MKRQTKNTDKNNSTSETLQKELERAIKASENCEKLTRRLSFDLQEREKELRCQDQFARLLVKPGLSITSFLKESVSLLSDAFQFPEKASVRITAEGHQAKTSGFKVTADCLEIQYPPKGQPAVLIQVCYKFKKNSRPEKIFLPEEKRLLQDIAAKIAFYISSAQKTEELIASENRYEYLINVIRDVIFKIDGKGVITYISPSIKNLLGYDAKEITGSDLFFKLLFDNLGKLKKEFKKLPESEFRNATHKVSHKDGTDRWLRSSSIIISEKGKVSGIVGSLSDITELKKIEAELHKSEKLYRSFLQASPDMIAVTDLTGKITFISQKSAEIFGLSDSSFFIGKNIAAFTSAEDSGRASNDLNQRLTGELFQTREYTAQKPDGTLLTLEVSGNFFNDESGSPAGMIFAARDVSSRKELEKKLKDSEALYKSVTTASPDIITFTDLEGKILFASPSVLKMFGGSSTDEFTGRNLMEFIHSDSHVKAINGITEMVKGNMLGAEEYVGLRLDGTTFDIEVNGEIIRDERGNPLNMMFVTRDITKRKGLERKFTEAEQLNRTVFEASPDGIVIHDLKGNIILASPKFAEMMGVTEPGNLTGRSLYEFTDSTGIKSPPAIAPETPDRKPARSFELKGLRADGKVIDIEVNAQPIIGEGGDMTRIVSIARDVTERKNLERLARESQEKYRTLVETVDEVIFDIKADGTIDFLSPSVFKLIGYTVEELIGKNFLQFVYEEDLKEIAHSLRSIGHNHRPFIDYRYRTKAGDIVWVRSSVVPVFEGEKIVSIRGTLMNITHQKEAEAKLINAERETSEILASMPIGVAVFDEKEKLVFTNSEFRYITGYTAEGIGSVSNWWEMAYPDGNYREYMKNAWYKETERSLATGTPFIPVEAKIRCADGSTVIAEVSFSLIGRRGVATFVDITARKKTEEMLRQREEDYRLLVESINDVIFEADDSGRIKYISPAVYDILGYHEEELTGRSFFDILLPEEREQFSAAVSSLETSIEQDVTSYEYRFFHKDRSPKWLRFSPSPVYTYGKLKGYRGVITDVNEKRLALDKLSEQKLYIESILRSLQDMIFVLDSGCRIIDYIAPENDDLYAPPEFFLNKSVHEIFPPELSGLLEKNILALLSGETVERIEYKLPMSDGLRYYEAQFSSLGADRVISKITNITQRKLTELRVTESERKFRFLFDNMAQGVIYQDANGEILSINPSALKILGLTESELKASSTRERFGVIREDGTEIKSDEQPVAKVKVTGKPVRDQIIGIFNPRLNDRRWLLVNAEPEYDDDGTNLIGIFETFTDITAQKKSENELLRQSKMQEILMKISTTYITLPQDKLSGAINESLKEIGEFIGADRFYIIEYDFKKNTSNNTYEWCADGIEPQIHNLQDISVEFIPDWVEKHRKGEVLIVENVQALPHGSSLREILEPQEIKSLIAVPIMVGDKCTGFAGFDSVKGYHNFSESETKLLKIFTQMLASVELRFKTEKAIAESEYRFRKLFENMAQGVIYQDADGIAIDANSAAERLLGLTVDQMRGRTSVHPEWRAIREDGSDFPGSEHPPMVALRTGKPVHNVIIGIYNPSLRSHVWLLTNGEPEFRDGEDKPYRVFSTFTDITESRNAALQLEENRRFLAAIIENSGSLIYVKSEDGRYITANRRWEEVTGISKKDTIGKTDAELFGADNVAEFRKNDLIAFNSDSSITTEEILDTPNGTKYFLAIKFPVRDANGQRTGICGMSTEITDIKLAEKELRASQERLSNLVNSQTNYVLRTDINGNYTYWNDKYREDFGWLYSEESLEKASALSAICPHHHQRTYETVEKCILRPGNIVKVELDKPLKDGSICTTLWEFVCLTDADGNPSEIQCMGIDITELKNKENELTRSNERSLSIMNAMESFIYIADIDTHELLFVNEYGSKTWGRDIVGKKCFTELQGSDKPCDFCTNKNLIDSEGNPTDGYNWEFQNLVNKRWYSIQDKAIRWNDGRLVRMEIATDITEKKEAEIKIRESEEKYRSLIDSSDAVIWMADREGKMLFLNSIAAANLGKTVEQMTGNYLSGYFSKQESDELLADIRDVIDSGTGKVKESEVIIRGSTGYFRTSIQPVRDEAGIPYAVMMFTTDITVSKTAELKIRQSEENYKTLFIDSPDGYLLIHDGRFIECNKASEALMRCKREQLIGITPDEVSPEYQPNGRLSSEYSAELIADTYRKGRNTFEWVHKRFDGTNFIAQVSLSVMNYEGKEVLFTNWQDITEKKRAEEEVRKLSRAVEQSPVSIVITNLSGDIEYANRAACETTGYALEELVGKNPRVLKSGDTSPEEYQKLWGSISKGGDWRGIFHNRRKNGDLYWESSTISPITDSGGKTTHYLAVKEDITERIRIQEELIKSQNRFSQVAEHSRTVIWEVDLDGLYTYVSETSEQVFGYKPEELTGRRHFYDIHPDNLRETFKTNGLSLIKAGRELKSFDNAILKPDGTLIWVSTNGSPVTDKNGNITGYRGSDIEITERKLAEEELRKFMTIAESANIGNVISDMEGNLLFVNEFYAKMHDMEKSEMIGKNLSICHTEDQLPGAMEGLKILFRDGRFESREVWHAKKDGTPIPTLMNALLIYDSDNVPRFIYSTTIDISERKKAEEELRKFRMIADKANYGNAISSMDGTLLYTNESFASMHGYTTEEITGRNLSMLHSEEQLVEVGKSIQILQQKGEFSSYEIWRTRKDGTAFPSLMNAMIMRDEFGKPQFMWATAVDITNLKQAELSLRNSEQRLNQAQEIANMGSWEFEIATGKVTWSKNYFKLVGVDPSAEPLPLEEIRKMVHPDDRDLFESKLSEMISDQTVETFDFRFILKDGSEKWIQASMVPFFDNDKLVSVSGVSIDITERKRIESEVKKLTLAIEQSPVSLVITDLDAQILYVSPAFNKTTGYTTEEAIGNKTSILKSGLTEKKVYVEMWETIQQGNPWRGELINKKKNGDLYWENISITPVMDEKGKIANYLAVKEDITERKKTQQEIEELNKTLEKRVETRTRDLEAARIEAEKANQAKSEFLSRMSHELRTPMNSILGFAQLLEMGALNTSQKKGVGHILKSGRHLLELINEVLDISRIEAGKLSLSVEAVELGSVLSEMIDTVAPLAVSKNVTIESQVAPYGTYYVMADRQRLKQVVLNLLNNAIKYNIEGGKVAISVGAPAPGEIGTGFIKVSVQDNGIGISEEDLKKIFIPFERIGQEKTATEGTGLGLAVVKKLIDLMEGHIGVSSTEGAGSVFWFELPVTESEVERAEHSGALAAGNHVQIQKHGTILYIEDNVSNIDLVEQILTTSRPGVHLVTSLFGKNAARLAGEIKPDLILLDLNLPDMHGSEVFTELRASELTADIPVVILSADAMQGQLKAMLDAGAMDYLTKPLEIADFLRVVDEIIK